MLGNKVINLDIVYNIEYIIQKVLFKPFYLIFVNRLNKVDKNEFRVF